MLDRLADVGCGVEEVLDGFTQFVVVRIPKDVDLGILKALQEGDYR